MRIRAKTYGNRYLVTEAGDVIAMNYRNGQQVRLLKPYRNPRERRGGYCRVNVNGHPRDVHRLVAECFVPKPPGAVEVNHIDGDKLNNRASNLEWVTHLENVRHAYRTGLITGAQIVRNARHPHPTRRTISEDAARRVKELVCDGLPCGIVAEMLGIRPGVVQCIRRGQTYKDVPWPNRARKDCEMNASEARWALARYRKTVNKENSCR